MPRAESDNVAGHRMKYENLKAIFVGPRQRP
jgi:hypothetical protein